MITAYISTLAFVVILFLTLRDIRIFHRTNIYAYRKGALRGLIAGFIALIGLMLSINPDISPTIGLLLTFIAVMINKKEAREDIFTHNETTLQRFLGAGNK
ncbi:MAG: hypothetical protein AEth_01312 [Candidatus Argoarchaeum ethanivorans]|uniref:Uncharacterized protein n=1 Tax=Candidatus Argoarchaeum ethanivorans TaxID=2608793 RepID=A0A8B3S2W7_9EURY|nr:MAG: hypothetical protein AEth_01312 [Candidatus Argoarchaeum ethanivorans]